MGNVTTVILGMSPRWQHRLGHIQGSVFLAVGDSTMPM